MKQIYIAFFGLLGVFARYYLGLLVAKTVPGPFPYGTFLINISGSFAIGIIYVLGVEQTVVSEELRVGLMVGLLGGYTTFSSYSLEISRLIEEAEFLYAGLYFSLSSVVGILGTLLGMYLARKLSIGG